MAFGNRGAALAVLLGIAAGDGAQADDAAPAPRTVAFGSLEGGRSAFASVGAKRSLIGTLDETGPTAMVTIGAGGSPEQLGVAPAGLAGFRPALQGSATVGYQWALGRTFLSLFAGAELDRDRFWSAAGIGREATRAGARVHGEIWMHPSADTLLTGTVIAGSARGHLWTRASVGYKVWRDVFFGPEATLYATSSYREWRLGLHATGLQLGRYSLRLSGGRLLDDSTRRRGAYGTMSVHVKL